ncbi:Isochorismatase family protein [compost metagenome]
MKINRAKAALLVIDMQPKVLQPVPDHQKILQNCQWLVGLCEDLEIAVRFSAHYSNGLGPISDELLAYSQKPTILNKNYFSCVEEGANTAKEFLLQDQWILCGIEAHACMMLTALDLVAAGKQVFVVIDAVGSRAEIDKSAALSRLQTSGVILVTREMVLFELLRCAGTEEFKACSKKYLK